MKNYLSERMKRRRRSSDRLPIGAADPALAKVQELLRRSPTFQVMTVDGLNWIEPFTGAVVEAPFEREKAAMNWYRQNSHWRGRKPLSQSQLQHMRWRIYLLQNLKSEPRLRYFSRNRGWLNPFSGQWESELKLTKEGLQAATITAMADVLSRCPEAQQGKLLQPWELERILKRSDSASRVDTDDLTDMVDRTPAVVIDGRAEAREEAREEDLKRAGIVQKNMLPQPPSVPGYEIGIHYSPLETIGGDFYDFRPMADGRQLLVLGDVSGHGVQAALVVSSALKGLRHICRQSDEIDDILGRLNDDLHEDLLTEQFITMFAAVLDPSAHSCVTVLRGHHRGILLRGEGDPPMERFGQRGLALGLVAGDMGHACQPQELQIGAGEVLVQFTDGILEAANAKGEQFGMLRTYASAIARADRPAQEIADGIAEDVAAFADGPLDDDVTIIVLRRGGVAADDQP